MAADARIVGRLEEAVSLEVVVRRVADGQMMAEIRTSEGIAPTIVEIAEAGGAREAPEAEGAQMTQETGTAPRTRAMMSGDEVVTSVQVSPKSSAGLSLFRNSRPGGGIAPIRKRSVSATEVR